MRTSGAGAILAVAVLCSFGIADAASALSIELKDVAPDRIERQRAAATGELPLPGTPDLANLDDRLAAKGMKAGMDVFLRVFKSESEVELWMRSGERFELFATYPMCHWSGTLGPKIREGDKQSPEGFYTVAQRQLRSRGRWPRSFNFGFPNAFDKAHGRSGSYILMHGGCSSVGCFAMTNAVINEIHSLVDKALRGGQDRLHVHVFPFRMTDESLARHQGGEWYEFWRNLKQGYDAFETTRLPPKISVCQKRYHIRPDPTDAQAEANGGTASPLASRRASGGNGIEAGCPPADHADADADDRIDAVATGPHKPRRRAEAHDDGAGGQARLQHRHSQAVAATPASGPALKQHDVSLVFGASIDRSN